MKDKKMELIERAKSAGISCINMKCKYWNKLFSQNCSAGTKEGGPFIEYCLNYVPEGVKDENFGEENISIKTS